MIRQPARIAVLAGAFLAAGAVSARACDGPAADGCGAPCAPPTRTVCVTEYVPTPVQETRTVFKTVCVQEKYTAFRTECVPEVKTRTFTVNRIVPAVRNETRTACRSC